jgi:hypothetical protein
MVQDLPQQVLAINPLNAELNPICHLLALLGAHHIVHVSRIRVKVFFLFSLSPKNHNSNNKSLSLGHITNGLIQLKFSQKISTGIVLILGSFH